jgi:ADP-ribose diphosphatase
MATTNFTGKYFSILLDEEGVEYVHTADEVLVVPVDEHGRALLIWEPAPAFGAQALVLPGGMVEPGEAHAATANREIQEEIGFRAGQIDALGELRPYSKYLTVRSHVFLARRLSPAWLKGDEGYAIQIEAVPLDNFPELIAAGRLHDARAIAALYLARDFLMEASP